MESDSDEDLPSLSTIVSRLQPRKLAVTTPSKHNSPVQDPAREAVTPKANAKLRTKSHRPVSTSDSQIKLDDNATSSALSDDNKQAGRSKADKKASTSRASPHALKVDSGTTTVDLDYTTELRSRVNIESVCHPSCFARRGQAGSPQAGSATLPCLATANQPCRPDVHASQMLSSSVKSPHSGLRSPSSTKSGSGRGPTEYLSAMSTPKHAKSATKARKQRRITIITISDSEEEAHQPPINTGIRSPARTSSPVADTASLEQDEQAEEVSFADYTETEDSGTEATVTRPGASRRVIDIDSSDSEYDGAAGVITWNPTPNKVKNIVKPSSFLLSPLPLSATDNTPSKRPSMEKYLTPERFATSTSHGKATKPELPSGKTIPKTPTQRAVQPILALTGSRITKRAAAFLKERDQLALNLIEELNTSVFENQLPEDLTVVWNGRLNTTAGRANWKKITNKTTNTTTHRAEIELSVKVVDSEEKLRCTLAHELCHIAAWAVDKEMKPAHGPAFKAWIMRARQDIKVTTKHTYEIAYKFRWQCTEASCGKTYGRHSNSIDPKRHACGACSGRLVRLDKHGLPQAEKVGVDGTPRKESEWTVFSRAAFKRIKLDQPLLTMTQINKLVAAEWAEVKAEKALRAADPSLLAKELGQLTV